MTKHRQRFLIILGLLLFAGAASLLLGLAYSRYRTLHPHIIYTPQHYSETADALDNPYQGWYHLYGYTLSDDTPIAQDTLQSHIDASAGQRLVLLEINLRQYADKGLSAQALSQLEDILAAWEQTPLQVMLRFLYDWDGNALQTEPQSLDIILQHMEQAAPAIDRHTGCIYLIQGVFVGNYGEMHGSAYTDPDSIRTLAGHLASVIDPAVFLSLRTPQHWRLATGSFSPEAAAGSGTAARFGLYNDGMLGSATDLGTYSDQAGTPLADASTSGDLSVRGSRKEELDFQDTLCTYVPNGGEAVIDNPYNDLETAIADLSRMHVSYLNSDYDHAVLEKWKNSTYQGAPDDPFHGMNGLDHIGRHLGYRYTITDSALLPGADRFFSYTPATLTLTIQNTGFSNCYRPFTAKLTAVALNTDVAKDIPINTDARSWHAGTSTTLETELDIRTLGQGSFAIYFSLADDADGELIRFANALPYDSRYGYQIGQLQIGE